MLTRKVWEESERADGPVENRAVELADYIRASAVARHDHDWSGVPRAHLAVERLLDLGMSHQNQRTGREVKVSHCVLVIALKLLGRANSRAVDCGL